MMPSTHCQAIVNTCIERVCDASLPPKRDALRNFAVVPLTRLAETLQVPRPGRLQHTLNP